MGHLRAPGRNAAHGFVFAAASLAVFLLAPVCAGASTGSHRSKAPAPAAVGAQLGPAHSTVLGHRTRSTGARTGARARAASPSKAASNATLPTGLDMLLGRL